MSALPQRQLRVTLCNAERMTLDLCNAVTKLGSEVITCEKPLGHEGKHIGTKRHGGAYGWAEERW